MDFVSIICLWTFSLRSDWCKDDSTETKQWSFWFSALFLAVAGINKYLRAGQTHSAVFPGDFSSFVRFAACAVSARCVSEPHWSDPTTQCAPLSLSSGLRKQKFFSASLLCGQGGCVAPMVLDVVPDRIKLGGREILRWSWSWNNHCTHTRTLKQLLHGSWKVTLQKQWTTVRRYSVLVSDLFGCAWIYCLKFSNISSTNFPN